MALGCVCWGGPSENGWSRESDFQRCPYRYYLKWELGVAATTVASSSASQDIGTFEHVLLAAHYARMLPDARYPGFRANCPTPAQVIEALQVAGAEPVALAETERLWSSYLDYWGEDGWQPMAVEMPAGDPILHTSRYDLVVSVSDGIHDGIWIPEHKTASPSTDFEQWDLHGEVLGEALSWEISKLDEVFGPLSGICINVLVKSRVPTYRRIWQRINPELVLDFAQHRALWQARINQSRKMNRWPKAHYGCMVKFDRCQFWDHCCTLSNSFLTPVESRE
jgi:hypothetical protein